MRKQEKEQLLWEVVATGCQFRDKGGVKQQLVSRRLKQLNAIVINYSVRTASCAPQAEHTDGPR